MRVRKKPVIVEAHQWLKNGDHPEDHVGERVPDPMNWSGGYIRKEGAVVRFFRHPDPEYDGGKIHDACGYTWHQHGWIDTLEGGFNVCPGDWIITGVHGEHYPIKPDIFKETYEEVIDE